MHLTISRHPPRSGVSGAVSRRFFETESDLPDGCNRRGFRSERLIDARPENPLLHLKPVYPCGVIHIDPQNTPLYADRAGVGCHVVSCHAVPEKDSTVFAEFVAEARVLKNRLQDIAYVLRPKGSMGIFSFPCHAPDCTGKCGSWKDLPPG